MKIKKLFAFLMLGLFSSSLYGGVYNFSYKIESDVRKTMYLVYKFRMFYKAVASADFYGYRTRDGRYKFYLRRINRTGYRIRTHRRGKKLSVVTADYSFARAKAAYRRAEADFRRSAPYYHKMNNAIARRPFRIMPTSSYSFFFEKSANGRTKNGKVNIVMKKPASMSPYNDSFNIYRLMGEMLKMNNHSVLPNGGTLKKMSKLPKNWKSPNLNYTTVLRRIGYLADFKAAKYLKFSQSRGFKMQYRYKKQGRYTIITGLANPWVSVGMGLKIRQVKRVLKIRSSNGILVSERFYLAARDSNGRGWSFSSLLRAK